MTDDTTTDTAERPQGALSVFTCYNRRHESRSCYALIENTRETRQLHRQWHIDQETDREALRGAVKSRDETIALLRQQIAGYGRDVAAYGQEVAGFHGEVQRVETPIVPPQLEIDRTGYTDDELDNDPDEPEDPNDTDDDWGIDTTDDATRTTPAAAAGAPQGDEDDDPHTVALPTTSSPSWAR